MSTARRDELAWIADEIEVCTRCELHKTRTKSVPGEGPADARVMLIGEAPGWNEDQQGRPFVGAAGKFLQELLASAREAVAKACSFAKYTAPDKYSGLADKELMASDPRELELAYTWELDSERAIRLAVECEDAARNFDRRITNSEGATVATNALVLLKIRTRSVACIGRFVVTSATPLWSRTPSTSAAAPGTP